MPRPTDTKRLAASRTLPLVIELDEDGFYVVECPVLPGCYAQGKTLDEALANIQEVLALLQAEKESKAILRDYQPRSISFQTITI